MLFLWIQESMLDRQPTTMEVSDYQRVKASKPDGTPDMKAPDNAFRHVKSTWYVMADSETVSPDSSGMRIVHVPTFKYKDYERYQEKGRPTGSLAEAFHEVLPQPLAVESPYLRGSGSIGGFNYEVRPGNRFMYFMIRTVVEEVEYHTAGRHRAERRLRRAFWSVSSEGGLKSGPRMPKPETMIAVQTGPQTKALPVVYGYTAFTLPEDTDF